MYRLMYSLLPRIYCTSALLFSKVSRGIYFKTKIMANTPPLFQLSEPRFLLIELSKSVLTVCKM